MRAAPDLAGHPARHVRRVAPTKGRCYSLECLDAVDDDPVVIENAGNGRADADAVGVDSGREFDDQFVAAQNRRARTGVCDEVAVEDRDEPLVEQRRDLRRRQRRSLSASRVAAENGWTGTAGTPAPESASTTAALRRHIAPWMAARRDVVGPLGRATP